MKRREFIALVGGAAVALPRVVRAQQPIPVIVFFNSGSPSAQVKNLAAFRNGLKGAGLVEGENVAIEFVWAENRFDGLETLAAEVIARRPSVIVSNTLAAIRAKSSTTTIPIVFTTGSDPVRDGLVTSLNRPGGNVTGVVFISGTVGSKRLELLRQLVPKAGTIAMLVNPGTSETDAERADVQAAAQAVGQQIRIVEIRNTAEIETAVAAAVAAGAGAGALLIGTGTFWFNNRAPIVKSAARHAVPAMYSTREPVEAGGLMSYGASISDAFHQAGLYTGQILKGEKPGDLPVIQSVKFDFIINLKTAQTLGLQFHPWAVAEGRVPDDPTLGVIRQQIKSTGYRTWSEDDIGQYKQRHPVGTMARLAIELLLSTAARRGDVVKFGPQHVKDGTITFEQHKKEGAGHHPVASRFLRSTRGVAALKGCQSDADVSDHELGQAVCEGGLRQLVPRPLQRGRSAEGHQRTWVTQGDIAAREKCSIRQVNRTITLAFIAPLRPRPKRSAISSDATWNSAA